MSFEILAPALPELFLALSGIALLMFGVFRGDSATPTVSYLAVFAFAITAVLAMGGPTVETLTFGDLFIVDGFGVFAKILVLLGAALSVIMSRDFVERERMARFEYPVIIVFATLGMLMMISANDLISLYLGLELQSLSLYVLAAFQRDAVRSSEAGLKYFVLGSLSSGMLLYGASMIYGFSGTTAFVDLAAQFSADASVSLGLLFGIVLVMAGLAFKISAVPFHMWTPDVYEGAPTPVTAYFAIGPKIAAIALLTRLLVEPFGELLAQWQQIVWAVALLSMLLGAFAGVVQSNIKRLMAYSSIGHIGFALVGLAAGTDSGVRGLLLYMAIYLPMTLGAFAVILCMRVNGRSVERIVDLSGLSRTHPMMAFAMAIFMFSMAGIPPLAGFFSKLYVFLPAIEAELYGLAIIGILTSVVSAYYYLRIVKLMYFDEPVEAFDHPVGSDMTAVLTGTGLFTLFFFAWPGPLVDAAGRAAQALF